MDDYKVLDNYLETGYFNFLRNTIFDTNFPWYLGFEGVIRKNDPHFQGKVMVHNFYNFHRPTGHLHSNPDFFDPLLEKLKPNSLIRVKANLYFKTEKIQEFRFHKDFPFPHKGAILCLNSNNGYTILNDGTKIDSVENRMILFNSSIDHAGSSCSDEGARVNININYV